MSKLSQLRKKVEYEPSVPRCKTCVHFRQSFVRLTNNSSTAKVPTWCILNDFQIDACGVCVRYENDKGETFI